MAWKELVGSLEQMPGMFKHLMDDVFVSNYMFKTTRYNNVLDSALQIINLSLTVTR